MERTNIVFDPAETSEIYAMAILAMYELPYTAKNWRANTEEAAKRVRALADRLDLMAKQKQRQPYIPCPVTTAEEVEEGKWG